MSSAAMLPVANPATMSKDGSIEVPGKRSYDSTMTDFEAELASSEVEEMGPLDAAIAKGEQRWAALQGLLDSNKTRSSRSSVAERLVRNHVAVLRDVTNPNPLSQLELVRVQLEWAAHADTALREITRRLLKRRSGAEELEERLDTLDAQQVAAWGMTAKYLDSRIQSSDHERPGRAPDMSLNEASSMRAACQEVWWEAYQSMRMSSPGSRVSRRMM